MLFGENDTYWMRWCKLYTDIGKLNGFWNMFLFVERERWDKSVKLIEIVFKNLKP